MLQGQVGGWDGWLQGVWIRAACPLSIPKPSRNNYISVLGLILGQMTKFSFSRLKRAQIWSSQRVAEVKAIEAWSDLLSPSECFQSKD